jgi:prepilin-type N-terminal cleavage/methylation domain-containing protein
MRPTTPDFPPRSRAFTLIELLTVIAIIGILAAIIFPTVSAVITKAHKAAVKAQVSQWTVGMQAFRADYSFYPQIDGSYAGSGGNASGTANVVNPLKFAIALTGTELNGTALPTTATAADLVGNSKRRNYYSIAQNEVVMDNGLPIGLQDAFGNEVTTGGKETGFAVLYDSNGDGFVSTADTVAGGSPQSAPTLTCTKTGSTYTPDPINDVNLSPPGIRAGVLFYTPGPGNSDGSATDGSSAVFSWK